MTILIISTWEIEGCSTIDKFSIINSKGRNIKNLDMLIRWKWWYITTPSCQNIVIRSNLISVQLKYYWNIPKLIRRKVWSNQTDPLMAVLMSSWYTRQARKHPIYDCYQTLELKNFILLHPLSQNKGINLKLINTCYTVFIFKWISC